MQITKVLLCLACAANMALPAEAMPKHLSDDDNNQTHTSTSEGYRLRFSLAGASPSPLKLSVNRPDGSPVNDAQVVIALIDCQGRHHITRATSSEEGYQVDTNAFATELWRVEAEVITGGQLLTAHFHIDPTT